MKALEKNRDSRRAKDPSVPPFDFKTEVRNFRSKCILIIASYGVNVSRYVYFNNFVSISITVEHTSGRWAVPQTRLKCKVGQSPRKVWCRLQVHKVRRRYVAFFCKLTPFSVVSGYSITPFLLLLPFPFSSPARYRRLVC